MNHPPLILFDGICNLCCWWVQFLIKIDSKAKFHFATLQSKMAQNILSSFENSTSELETVFYIKENRCFQKSAAILEILQDLGGIWVVFSIFKLIPIQIRNYLYKQLARKRYHIFGQRTSCMLPTPDIQKRFLS